MGDIVNVKSVLLTAALALGISGCGSPRLVSNDVNYGSRDAKPLEMVIREGETLGDSLPELTGKDWGALKGGSFDTDYGVCFFAQRLSFSQGSGEIIERSDGRALHFSENKTTFKYELDFDEALAFDGRREHHYPQGMYVNILGEYYEILRVDFDPEERSISMHLESLSDPDHYIVFRDSDFTSGRFTERESVVDGKELDTAIVTINAEWLDDRFPPVLRINHIKYADQVGFGDYVTLTSCESLKEDIAPERTLSPSFDMRYVNLRTDTPGKAGCAERVSRYSLMILSE